MEAFGDPGNSPNEKVAHGSRLNAEVIRPLLDVLGDRAAATFTTIDEAEVLDLAVEHKIIGTGAQARYLPDLDYMAHHEPRNSFRLTS